MENQYNYLLTQTNPMIPSKTKSIDAVALDVEVVYR